MLTDIGAKMGIYAITNKANGRMYIGQSADIPQRLKTHWTSLKSGRHQNRHLQQDYDAFGAEEFNASLLQKVAHELMLSYLERWWWDFYANHKGVEMYSNVALDGMRRWINLPGLHVWREHRGFTVDELDVLIWQMDVPAVELQKQKVNPKKVDDLCFILRCEPSDLTQIPNGKADTSYALTHIRFAIEDEMRRAKRMPTRHAIISNAIRKLASSLGIEPADLLRPADATPPPGEQEQQP